MVLNYNLNTSIDTEHFLRRAWRYQRGNQNPYIEEEQLTQWQKENVQKSILFLNEVGPTRTSPRCISIGPPGILYVSYKT